MKIIESVRDYIGSLNCINTFAKAIGKKKINVNVNYLGIDVNDFSIEEVPCEPVVKTYLDGSSVKQFQFTLCSRFTYGSEVLQNIENSNFYEDFSTEIEENNLNDILPQLDGKLESNSIKILTSAIVANETEDNCIYQIGLVLKYTKHI